ncbi:MAG TPA: NrfD/PsrC family molybdoenzyme membrane anchor subunit [Rubrobacter sp.]|nr:NrfD/PsrC family molybdoenzyme membrane anchor subunit [Rubrobacter sp.]
MSEATSESVQQSNGRVETSHHPETDPKRKDKNYYGIPPIKRAHWTWQVPIYFWIGGIGAGTQLFATVAQLLGHEDDALKRASRYTVLVTMLLSPVLLIWDLGRPERFYNMLRILKLRSPMSTQSWSLFTFGNLGGLIAARQAAEDGLLGDNFLSRLALRLIPARLLTVLALPFGLFVGFNTGNLVSATSVPIWARNWMLMGPTFLASGVSTALSWLSLVLHLGHWGEAKTLRVLHRAEKAVIAVEAGLIALSLARMSRWSKPLFSKEVAPLFVGGTLLGGIAAPFALLAGKGSRSKSMLASVLALAGGLAFRFAIIIAGRKSADDPEAYFTFASGESAPQPEDKV